MLLFVCSEKANLAVTLVNSSNEVIAFAAFFDYPNIPSVDQANWETWLNEKFTTKATVSKTCESFKMKLQRYLY